MYQITLKIDGMACSMCESHVCDTIRNQFKVKKVSASHAKGEAVIKHVDLGIGLSHFHQTSLELGLSGRFAELPQNDIALPEELHYAVSWLPA